MYNVIALMSEQRRSIYVLSRMLKSADNRESILCATSKYVK